MTLTEPVRLLLVLASSGGGVGRHVRALASGLAAQWPVTVAGPAATGRDFAFEQVATFVAVEIADRPSPPADLRAARRLRALLAEHDVVHAHGLRAGALAVLAARTLPARRRPPLIVTLHNALTATGAVAVVYGALERIVARGADTVLVVSHDLGARMTRLGARDVQRALVPAPALPLPDAGQVTRLRAAWAPEGTALLVTVARLAPQKGLPDLVEALALLRRRRPDLIWQAVIAGEGPMQESLHAQVASLALPVRLLGARDDVPALLGAADLVVVPSHWEGQPLIVQEALRAGAALVVTDAGGTREVAGDGARYVPARDTEALAAAISDLLESPRHRADLQRHAAAAALSLPPESAATSQVQQVAHRLRHTL